MHRILAIFSAALFITIVTVLGFVTPGYDFLRHTISRLAIEEYSWIQIFNFLQLAVGMWVGGMNMSEQINNNNSKSYIKYIFGCVAIFLVLAAVIKTDQIENTMFSIENFTLPGLIHASLVIVFLCLSPLGIIKLVNVLRSEKAYRKYAKLTLFMGYVSLVASIVWFIFFGLGMFTEYRGIFQKLIALWSLSWFMILNYNIEFSMRPHR